MNLIDLLFETKHPFLYGFVLTILTGGIVLMLAWGLLDPAPVS